MRNFSAAAMAGGFLVMGSQASFGATADCPAPITVAEATRVQMAWFDALGRLDQAAYDRLTTPDFVVDENGRVETREEEFAFFERMTRAGNHARWSVTDPRLQSDCSLAVLSYRDVGEVKIGQRPSVPMQWLEVVVYRHGVDGWRLSLASSMRDADFADRAPKVK